MFCAVAIALLSPTVPHLRAEEAPVQELQSQITPYSAYLDLRAAPTGAPSQTVPAWIEAFEFMPAGSQGKTSDDQASRSASSIHPSVAAPSAVVRTASAFRIRLQAPAKVSDELQMRVFFEDRSMETRPCVTAWDELGTEVMRSSPLGQGIGLATSETLTIPMSGVNYLEIETNGDGKDVRGVFFSWLEKAQIRQPIDFPSIEKVTEPFKVISAILTRTDDSVLYGVVTASLQQAPMSLTASTPIASIQFELEKRPLAAIVTYEVLGASLNEPPLVRMNSRGLGVLDLILPDLADPGYRGESREGDTELGFHYTGWIRAQKVIPGQLLLAGLNELDLELSNGADPIAVRSVQIQLKYNWEKLDYVLAPVPHLPAR